MYLVGRTSPRFARSAKSCRNFCSAESCGVADDAKATKRKSRPNRCRILQDIPKAYHHRSWAVFKCERRTGKRLDIDITLRGGGGRGGRGECAGQESMWPVSRGSPW